MENPERRAAYLMTSPITRRMIKIFRIAGSQPLEEIIRSRKPRYASMEGTEIIADDVTPNVRYAFDSIFVNNHAEAYQMLKSGDIDAYFSLDTQEASFDEFEKVEGEDFFPLVFKSCCLLTRKDELNPVISIVEKALNSGSLDYLAMLKKEGYKKYLQNKLYGLLTEEERLYVQNSVFVPFAAEFNNYPVSFFDANAGRWEGIYFETLNEIAEMTGLSFERANSQDASLPELIAMLEKGEALIISELFHTQENEGRFLWSDVPLLIDNYAFVTRSDFRDIELAEIPNLHTGVRRNTPYYEVFSKMFPDHQFASEYDTSEDVWAALKNNETDVVFSTRRRLLIYTNYNEEAGFKLNLIFNEGFDTSLGFNKDSVILKSVIDKAMKLVNINNISNRWLNKSYDYQYKLVAAQRPWLIGAVVLFFIVLFLVLILLQKSLSAGKELEQLVRRRTADLERETTTLKAMFNASEDFIFCKDVNSLITRCNKSVEDYFNISEDDAIGKNDMEVFGYSKEGMDMLIREDREVIEGRKSASHEGYLPSLSVGKQIRFIETVKTPLIQNGEVVGILGIARDITRRKEMEDELAFKSSKLQMIIDSIPDILFCKDTNFKYTQCNKHFEKYWGVSEIDILGLTDENGAWFSPELIKRMRRSETAVMSEDRIITGELTILAPLSGKEAVFEAVLSPLKQKGVIIGLMGIARDVTVRKEMEEAIKAASSAKSAFLANMSHELRTPLNVVIGLTDLLLEDRHMPDHIMSNLLKISTAGGTLLSIVNDVLDFSKIESGKLEINPVEYYTASLLNDVITIVVTRLAEKPVAFNLDIDADLPGKLYGDDLRVKQIFTNLLNNAVKYTNKGSINFSVNCTREGDIVWMDAAVSDTGIGIRSEDIEKLFSEYNQVDTKANRSIEGTGLGLAITKRLAVMMQGNVRVESEYGKGTTFRVRVRQGFVNDAPIGKDAADKLRHFCFDDDKRLAGKKLVRLNLSYARVLVVDDMQTNLDVAAGFLGKYKMKVDCLNNGKAAIERVREGVPVYNAIFMDHMMPGMDGIETAYAIRALDTEYARNIPIIALTANAIHGTENLFFEHGFQAFISKPIDVKEMDSVIRKWVRDGAHEDVPIYEESFAANVQAEGEDITIEIPGVDVKKALSLYDGSLKIYLPLLRSYAANTPAVLEKLRSVTAETLSDYVITVHGLKGTSANVGAQAIREAALELEMKSRDDDLDFVLENNGKLIHDAEIIVENIKAWLRQYDESHNAKPRLKAPDRKLLSKLKRSFENYDMKGINTAMTELKIADYDEDSDLPAWLAERIEVSEFAEAAERLAKYEEENK
jgi:PAS domain S-box-containing protein